MAGGVATVCAVFSVGGERDGGGEGGGASFNLLLALLCLTNTILSSQTVSGGKRHLES